MWRSKSRMKAHDRFEYEVFPPIDSGEEEEELH